MMVFRRCDPSKRCSKCKTHARLYETPKNYYKLLDLPRKKEEGAMFFNPKTDPQNPEHNITYLDLVQELKQNKMGSIDIDGDLKEWKSNQVPGIL